MFLTTSSSRKARPSGFLDAHSSRAVPWCDLAFQGRSSVVPRLPGLRRVPPASALGAHARPAPFSKVAQSVLRRSLSSAATRIPEQKVSDASIPLRRGDTWGGEMRLTSPCALTRTRVLCGAGDQDGIGTGMAPRIREGGFVPAEVGFSVQFSGPHRGRLPSGVALSRDPPSIPSKDLDGELERSRGNEAADHRGVRGRRRDPIRSMHESSEATKPSATVVEKKLPWRCEACRAQPSHKASPRRLVRHTRMERALQRPCRRRKVVDGSEEEEPC